MKMRWTTYIVAIVTLLLLSIAVLTTASVAQDAPAKQRMNEFAGKVVTVYLSDPQKGAGQILTDAELIEIGGRWMLVGTGADTGRDEDWTAGVRIGIAWDNVQIYYAMTEKQFDEKIKKLR